MRRYVDGEATTVPYRLGRQLVAARYGTSPALVDTWAARDYLDAVAMLEATLPVRISI